MSGKHAHVGAHCVGVRACVTKWRRGSSAGSQFGGCSFAFKNRLKGEGRRNCANERQGFRVVYF